jgi:RNA-binding protein
LNESRRERQRLFDSKYPVGDVHQTVAFTTHQTPTEVAGPWVNSEHQHESSTVLGARIFGQVRSDYLFSGFAFVHQRLCPVGALHYGRGTLAPPAPSPCVKALKSSRVKRPMNPLTGKQRSYLRALAHEMDPVVHVGKAGLSEGVVEQVREQLRAHELIKLRFAKECEVSPEDASEPLATQVPCQIVQKAGRVLTVYKRHDNKPKIELPKAPRVRPASTE